MQLVLSGSFIVEVRLLLTTELCPLIDSSCGVFGCREKLRRLTAWWRHLLSATVSATLVFSSPQVVPLCRWVHLSVLSEKSQRAVNVWSMKLTKNYFSLSFLEKWFVSLKKKKLFFVSNINEYSYPKLSSLEVWIFHNAIRSNSTWNELVPKLFYLADVKSADVTHVMEYCLAFGK